MPDEPEDAPLRRPGRGLRRAGRIALTVARDAWLALGVLLLLLVVAELVARALHLGPKPARYYTTDWRDHAEPGDFWHDYYAELDRLERQVRWTDYAVFQGDGPWQGRWVHLDGDGHRATVNPPPASGRVRTVVVFGGSTVWGWSQREEHTIPSELARALNRAGIAARVENQGQIAYLSSQELVAFWRLLGSGRPPPDAVVFLDGLNDVSLGLVLGPDVPSHARRMARDFDQGNRAGPLLGRMLSRTALWRAFLKPSAPPGLAPAEVEPFADEVARRYAANVAAIEGLARAYHVDARFYWQPVMAFKKKLSRFESEAGDYLPQGPNSAEAFRATTVKVRALLAERPRFRDLSELFSDDTETIYTDGAHYTEAAAARIAARIAEDFAQDRESR